MTPPAFKVKFINEDYIEDIDSEDIVSDETRVFARNGATEGINFKYQIILYFTLQNYNI